MECQSLMRRLLSLERSLVSLGKKKGMKKKRNKKEEILGRVISQEQKLESLAGVDNNLQ